VENGAGVLNEVLSNQGLADEDTCKYTCVGASDSWVFSDDRL